MKQFINFHQLKESDELSGAAINIVYTLILTVVIFSVAQLWVYYNLSKSKQSVAILNKAVEMQKTQITELSTIMAVLAERSDRSEDLVGVKSELNRKRALVGVLEGSIKGSDSFLSALEGLAQHNIAGLWLTNVTLIQGGGILIEGRTKKMSSIPLFAEALSAMPVFSKVDFSKMEITKASQGEISFSLSSTLYSQED